VDITFSVAMPPGDGVAIAFTGGIDDISQQSVAALLGDSLQIVNASQTGWTLSPPAAARSAPWFSWPAAACRAYSSTASPPFRLERR
jgi:hypothetical protein